MRKAIPPDLDVYLGSDLRRPATGLIEARDVGRPPTTGAGKLRLGK